ncbi:MAG TPA: hypothetical protein VMF33_05130 [Acidimicrobiales bacterium]|nr:hypothetical protein [Acidimicrobiales bacterium]
MTNPPPKRSPSRTSLSFLMVAFVVAAVISTGASPWGPIIVLICALLCAAVLWRRLRPKSGTGLGILSTNCEKCGSLLRGVMGFSQKSCPQCGHVQSWGL